MNPQISFTKIPLLPFKLFKAAPNRFVRLHAQGKVQRAGQGLSGWLVTTTGSLESIPTGTLAIPFSVEGVTKDHQNTVISGAAIFTIEETEKLAKAFDFSVGDRGEYLSQDPQKVGDRLSEIISAAIFSTTSQRTLSELLENQDKLSEDIGERLVKSGATGTLGLEKSNLAVTNVSASPEIAQALMTIKAEELKKGADTAVHDRQMEAELKDRQLKQEQLATAKTVQESERAVLESKMETAKREAVLEEEIQQLKLTTEKNRLIHEREEKKLGAENAVEVARIATGQSEEEAKQTVIEGEARGKALEAQAKALAGIDAKKLQALALQGGSPGATIGAAFLELAERAEKIGVLNITPDLLESLTGKERRER
jgi:hypothetical protein